MGGFFWFIFFTRHPIINEKHLPTCDNTHHTQNFIAPIPACAGMTMVLYSHKKLSSRCLTPGPRFYIHPVIPWLDHGTQVIFYPFCHPAACLSSSVIPRLDHGTQVIFYPFCHPAACLSSSVIPWLDHGTQVSRIVAMSFCEPRSWSFGLSS